MGTLATLLAGRKIPTFADRYRADVEGDIEDADGVLRITRIRVRYTLAVPPGKTSDARYHVLGTARPRCMSLARIAPPCAVRAPATAQLLLP